MGWYNTAMTVKNLMPKDTSTAGIEMDFADISEAFKGFDNPRDLAEEYAPMGEAAGGDDSA